MNAWVYQADLWCDECAAAICRRLQDAGDYRVDEGSDAYPQGPYSNGGGEADTPQHCGGCGKFLENPLTTDGTKYAREKADEAKKGLGGKVIQQWIGFYYLGGMEIEDGIPVEKP